MSRSLRFLLAVALWLGLAAPTFAASSNVNSLTASGAIAGTQLFYCPIGASSDLKCTAAQIAAFNYSLMSGDCTASSAGVVTCSNVVRSFSSTCPATGPSVGSVVLSNGVPAIAEGSAFNISQCGAFYEVTGTTTGTLPAPAAGLSFIVMNAGTGTVTVASNGGATNINNAGSASLVASLTLSPGQQVGFVANNAVTGWDATPESGPAGPTGPTGPTGPAGPSITGPGYTEPNVWFVPGGMTTNTANGGSMSPSLTFCTPGNVGNILAAGGGSGTLNGLATRITTLGSTNIQLAIYTNDTTVVPYRPGFLIANTTSIANTAVGVVSGAISASISGSTTYWFCLQTGDTAARFLSKSGTSSDLSFSSLVGSTTLAIALASTTSSGGVDTASTFGTWPSSLHGSTWSEIGTTAPILAISFGSIP